tara:strand:+ start:992 stop:2212 length:1221 start_codon:yes stop_codon:yes gene_type:complete
MSLTFDEERSPYLIQKIFPSINNNDFLEFRIPPNSKGNIDLSGSLLHLVITIPELSDKTVKLLPQNYFGLCQFSSLEIRINGEALTHRTCANEYYLSGYFQYITNYASEYIISALGTIGVFDNRNFTCHYLDQSKVAAPDYYKEIIEQRTTPNNSKTFEIIMPINSSIFYTNSTLPTNTAVELSFERTSAKQSTVFSKTPTTTISTIDVFTLEDAYLTVPVVKNQKMLHLEKNISKPIKIKYDEYLIHRFNVPKGNSLARIANAITGKFPAKLFWGLMTIDAYNGTFKECSLHLQQHNVNKCTLYVDGNPVPGYPVTMHKGISQPYMKWVENTSKYLNPFSSTLITPREFSLYHFIYSAQLDPDASGSMTFEFEFKTALNKDLVLIVCAAHERTMQLDQFRNFKLT